MRKVRKIEVGTDAVREDIRTYEVGIDGILSIDEGFAQFPGDCCSWYIQIDDGTAVRHLSVLRVHYGPDDTKRKELDELPF
jgi:hypothetical protein